MKLPITFYLKEGKKLPRSVSLLLQSDDVIDGIEKCLKVSNLFC